MPERSDSPVHRRTLSTLRRDLVLTSCLVATTFAIVMAAAVFAPLAAHLARAPMGTDEIAGLADYALFLHVAFWPVIALSLISCVASALILYRRMRSPLVRFVRAFDAIRDGHAVPRPIRIRANDYLWVEADALNAMLECLAQRAEDRAALRDRLVELHADLVESGTAPETLEELLAIAKSPVLSVGAEGNGEAG